MAAPTFERRFHLRQVTSIFLTLLKALNGAVALYLVATTRRLHAKKREIA
jgi:hypothetical protein